MPFFWFDFIKSFSPDISRGRCFRILWSAYGNLNLEMDTKWDWIISAERAQTGSNVLPQIPQWYLLEKHFYSISESSKPKYLPVSSVLGGRAKFPVCSPPVLCSLFPNVILLLQIFLELSGRMDGAQVPASESFSARTCSFSLSRSNWLFLAFWDSTQGDSFLSFCLFRRCRCRWSWIFVLTLKSLFNFTCALQSCVFFFFTCIFSVWLYYINLLQTEASCMQSIHSRSCSQTPH